MNSPLANPAEFAFSGNAIFTVVSNKTGKRITFKVRGRFGAFTVYELRGPDNTKDYAKIGAITHDIYAESAPRVAARWVFNRLLKNKPLPNCEVYHEGRCGCCGRLLTVPESIRSGIGPECSRKCKSQ